MANESVQWNDEYGSMIDRNLGILTREEQGRLKDAKVSIFGIGGLGGVILEILARSGVERFSIVDNDAFEPSNLNRQNLAFQDTIGEMKIAVAERFCRNINPGIRLERFDRVDQENCSGILAGSDVAALVLDDVKACLTISRTARRMSITFVEGWALPFANVCTFTPETPSFEQTYGLSDIESVPVSRNSRREKQTPSDEGAFRFRPGGGGGGVFQRRNAAQPGQGKGSILCADGVVHGDPDRDRVCEGPARLEGSCPEPPFCRLQPVPEQGAGEAQSLSARPGIGDPADPGGCLNGPAASRPILKPRSSPTVPARCRE